MLQLLLLDYIAVIAYVDAANYERPSRMVCWSVYHLVSPAKNSEAIEIQFALLRSGLGWAQVKTYYI